MQPGLETLVTHACRQGYLCRLVSRIVALLVLGCPGRTLGRGAPTHSETWPAVSPSIQGRSIRLHRSAHWRSAHRMRTSPSHVHRACTATTTRSRRSSATSARVLAQRDQYVLQRRKPLNVRRLKTQTPDLMPADPAIHTREPTPLRGAACTAGSYCPQGSAAGTFCPPGTVSNSTSLISAEECDTCPVGHFCVSGIASSCAVSTYNPLVGQFLRTACMSCPENAVTIRTAAASAADCVCIVGHYNHRPTNATAECTPCPVGANCTDQGTTLASLQLFTGYYRTSTASIDLRRCPDFGDGSGCVGGMSDGEGPCKPKLEARLHSTRHMHAHATC